jgi:glycosyltransferase involved in cell wall biosynthesis
MKILQLSNRIPFPLNDGGNIGVNYYTEGFLQAGVELSFLAMNTTRHWVDIANLPSLYSRLNHFETVKVDNNIKAWTAFLNLFKGSSYNIDRFISREFAAALQRILERNTFDIIQLESLFLSPYVSLIRKYSKAKVVIRQHNVEFKIWERLAEKENNFFKKRYLTLLAKRLKKFETDHINDYDLLLPISRQDAEIFKGLGLRKPLFLHPFGIDTQKTPFLSTVPAPVSLYHIGAMDWLPNLESIQYFLNDVMPLVHKKIPDLKLYLAGRNMPEYFFRNKWENVEVAGEVPDAAAFEQDKTILIVPLLSGGGVRIKIFQAMAMGKAIVTTPVGLEGIEAEDGKEVMIAGDTQTFVRKIMELVRDPEKIKTMGLAARRLVEAKYDRKNLIAALLKRYEQLL